MFLAGLESHQIERAIRAIEKNRVGLSPAETENYLDVLKKMRDEIQKIRTGAQMDLKDMRFVIDALIPKTEEDVASSSKESIVPITSQAVALPVSIDEEVVSRPLGEVAERTITKDTTPTGAVLSPKKSQAKKQKSKKNLPKEEGDAGKAGKVEPIAGKAIVEEVLSKPEKATPDKAPTNSPKEKTTHDYLIEQGFQKLSETKYQNGDKDFYIEFTNGKVDYSRSIGRITGSWKLNSEEKRWVAEIADILASESKKK